MSRTDVHRPYRVQQEDPYDRHHWYRFPYWPQRQPDLLPLRNLCGCPLCADQHHRKARVRRERTRWRTDRAQILATTATDRDTIDPTPARPSR